MEFLDKTQENYLSKEVNEINNEYIVRVINMRDGALCLLKKFKTLNDAMGYYGNIVLDSVFVSDNTIINAKLGYDVSRATMRNQDIIPTFLDVLKYAPEIDVWAKDKDYKRYMLGENIEDDDVIYFVEDLFDTLNNYAPESYYFGSHEGDGSLYGFWEYIEE